ncbi:hypothetical protein ACUN3E_37620 [Streptomyces sp. Ju416(a)]
MDATGLTPDERADGALLISPHSAYGPGGRSDYIPDGESRWRWNGDTA